MRKMGATFPLKAFPHGVVAILLTVLLVACGNSFLGGGAARYHVNFARGNDDNPGTAAEPWKHAPGDPSATGKPAETQLEAGDRVIFAAGVVYRGEIKVIASGTSAAPIVFEGAPGAPAIIDGSDSLSFTRCAAVNQCGGLPNWRNLVLVSLPSPLPADFRLFADRGFLRFARTPDPRNDFYIDEPADMLPATPEELAKGEVRLPAGSWNTDGYRRRVAVWVQPNVVEERTVLGVAGGIVRFDAANLKYYPDRAGRYAVIGIAGALDRAGEYVVLADGRHAVLFLPPGASRVSIASGRGGFRLVPGSHVVIRNLTFRHMTDGGNAQNGIAISSQHAESRFIAIKDNRFVDMDMPLGRGPIILNATSDVTISGNVIERIMAGSGMRLGGPGRNMAIIGNRLDHIGRTGVMLMNVENAVVEGNVIANVRGVHGNGMSAYLGNRHIRFFHNTVLDARTPVTFHGLSPPTIPLQSNDIEFRENLLIADSDSPGSLIAWGETARDIQVMRNVLLGGRYGLRIPPGNENVALIGNVGVAPRQLSPGWQAEGNRWLDASPGWERTLSELARQAAARGESVSFDCRQVFGAQKVTRIGANIECAP